MAATFKDFIVECELYPYSRENFEFMKECSEIALSEKFIIDQVFLAEARETLANTTIEFEENFFQESVDEYSLEVLTEKFNIKVNGILSRMLTKVIKVFNIFSKFFGKIGNKFDPVTTRGQEVRSLLGSTTFDDQKIADIKKIVNEVKSNDASAFPIRANQPYKKNIHIKYGGHDQEFDTLLNDLAVALSDSKVVAEALLNDAGDDFDAKRIGIMDPDEIYSAGMALCVGKESAVKNVTKNMWNSWLHVKKNGLTIDVNTKSINNTAAKLNDLCKQITEVGNAIANASSQSYSNVRSTIVNAGQVAASAAAANAKTDETGKPIPSGADGILGILANLDSALPKSSEVTTLINDAVSMFTATIGLTTKVYTQLSAYRQAVITRLHDYLKNSKKD